MGGETRAIAGLRRGSDIIAGQAGGHKATAAWTRSARPASHVWMTGITLRC